ncbi:MAG: TIM barrel protein [Candidatus Acidiferrales bacterium]
MNRREFSQLSIAAAIGHTLLRGAPQSTPSSVGSRLSFMLWALEKQAPFDQCIEIVGAAGYQGVELVGEFYNWSDADTTRIMARMRALGMIFDAMSGVKAGFAVPDQSADFATQFAAQATWAKKLECSKIILLSGKRVEGVSPDVQRLTAIDNLKRAADSVAKDNIEIVIEPIDLLENPTIYLSTVTDGFDIVRAAGSPNLKVLYDIYHEQRSYGNLIEKLENNIGLVGLIHIADVPGRHEPGTGEIDYANIYRKLAELNYDKFMAMEYYPTSDPTGSLRASRLGIQQALAH